VDAANAAAAAKKEGFPSHAIIFLDVEKAAVCPLTITPIYALGSIELARTGYRAGVYCSGMTVDEATA